MDAEVAAVAALSASASKSDSLRALVDAHDWAATPLGPREGWPQPLLTLVEVMLGSAQPMFVAWGPERVMVYNDGYAPILGQRHPSALGRRFDEIWSDILDDVGPIMDRAYAGEPTHMDDIPLVMHRHGYPEETHFAFSYTPVPGESGRVEGMFCACTETTEAVRARREHEASEARLRGVLDGMTEGFVLLGPDFRVLDINAEGLRFETRPREAILGRSHWEVWPGTEESALGRLYKRAMAERVPVAIENRYVWPDGREGWFDVRAYPTADGGLALFYRNVSERRRAEEALRASEEFTRRVLQSSADCIKVLGLDGRLEFMSEGGMCVMEVEDFGVIEGTCWPDFWQGDEHANALAAVAEAKRGGTGRFQGFATTMKGTPRWWDVIVTSVNGPSGGPEKLLSVSRDVTATKQAEEALRVSEARLRFLGELDEALRQTREAVAAMEAAAGLLGRQLGASRCAYADVDRDNDGFVIRADYTAPEVATSAGTYSLDLFGPRAAIDMRQGRTLVVRDMAAELALGEGREMFLSIGIQAIVCCPLVKEGRLAAMMAVHQAEPRAWREDEIDLIEVVVERCWAHVERVGAEARLRASEAKFQAIANSVDQMIWSTRPDGYHDYYNQRWYDYTGVPQGSTDGEAWNGMFHPGDQERAWARWRHSLTTGEPYEIDYRLRHRSGEYRWVIGRAQCVRDARGRITRWFGTCTDVHDLKVTEERLRESEERLRLATENAEVGFWDVDVVNDVLIWPPRVKAMFGISADVPVSMQDFYEGLHLDDRDATSAAYAAAADPGRRALYDVEYRTIGKEDGVVRWVAAKGRGVFDESGRCVRVLGTAIDVTSRKQIEERLRELNETLERRVEERTRELMQAEEALRQSQKMEAVGQLTGGLAHDFNNLLTGIAGSLELMQTRMNQGRLTDLDRYINAAQGASKRAAALTHRLLAFSRRQTLDPKPTDVNALVAGMAELIRRTVGPEIAVEVVAAGGLWSTLVDPPQLENALLNLCINARDAMPDGGRIIIETANKWLDDRAARERDLPPGQYLSLCVTDTGTGMPPDVIARAFDPFFTTKPTGQGTGLGLSMIYGFVRQSGGQVRVYSELGQGTTMCLYLPRHYGKAEGEVILPDLADAPRAEQGETVLIVDDEPTVRMLVTEVLEDLGYTAIEAADGAAGLKVLQSDVRIDLLVTDVGLPGGMNGRQMADAARVKRPDLKVLFITGYAENAAVGNGHLEPGMQVLTKPFVMETLASRIKDLITGG